VSKGLIFLFCISDERSPYGSINNNNKLSMAAGEPGDIYGDDEQQEDYYSIADSQEIADQNANKNHKNLDECSSLLSAGDVDGDGVGGGGGNPHKKKEKTFTKKGTQKGNITTNTDL